MKTNPDAVRIGAVRQRRRGASRGEQTGLPRGRLQGPERAQSRVQQNVGSYKRLEVHLGVEAAIALRQLMRDGRSAREVIEALLLAEKQRIKELP